MAMRKKFRIYALQLVRSAVADAMFTGSIQVDPGQDFFMTSMHASDSADGSALGTQIAWLANAQDNEGGYIWSDGFAERSAFFSDRILGYQLPDVFPLKQNTRIQWTVKNPAAAPAAGTATLELRGYVLVQA